MCGINGIIQFNNKFEKEKMHNIVHKMNNCIIHRGPSGEGLFADEICAIGMRRLAIIDLQGGSQPIWNENHSKMVVFNGEIYNYRDLKADLKTKGHIFSTNSDTEVIIHGYESYGKAFFDKLEGMFTIAIYDMKLKKWILARDRTGEKPLYYYKNNEFMIFASELKSIFSTDLIEKEIDKMALATYFQLTYIPAPMSIIKDVHKLMPASVMEIDSKGRCEVYKYWNLDVNYEDIDYKDYNLCKEKLRESIFNSVEKRMISDVPLGAFLSGGFDSSIIVGVMSQLSNKPVNTFTIGFNDKCYDESDLAEVVAKKNNTNHQVLMLDWMKACEDLEVILDNIDEPFADSSLIATYEVSKLTKQFVTVALTGDAGDELFAGYDKYLIAYYNDIYQKIPKIIKNGIIAPMIGMAPINSSFRRKAEKVIKNSSLSRFEQRKQLMCLGFKMPETSKLIKDYSPNSLEFIERDYYILKNRDEQLRTQYVDFNTVLEGDMLAKIDRGSMLASLETRVPLLDKRVIELAFKMPTDFKINGKQRKIILKDTFKDLLPNELFHKPKRGFRVPIGEWLECELKEKLYNYATPDFIEEQGLFNADYINNIIESHMYHKENRSNELWTFFVFQRWYCKYIKNDSCIF